MANYGKILTPLASLYFLLVVGFVIAIPDSFDNMWVQIHFFVSLTLTVMGIARLVQGKDRKVMGQIVRPKAAAKASAVWALYFFNITPFLFPDSRIMYYSPPFPLAIWANGYYRYEALGYTWVPFVTVTFFIVWFASLFFIKNHPKAIHILFDSIMLVCFTFWLNFGVQFLLWTFQVDKSGLFFFDQWNGKTDIKDLAEPLSLSIVIIAFALILVIRMVKKLEETYSNLTVKGSKKVLIFIAMVSSYLLGISPIYFGIQIALRNESYLYPYVNYIGIVVIGIVLIVTISTLIETGREFSKQLTGEGATQQAASFGFSTAIFLVIFFIAWAPIFLPIVDHGMNTKNNSVYNYAWNGWSNFKSALEEQNYSVMVVQSSLSVISRLDPTKQVILVIGGPNVYYNPASEIPFFLTAFRTNFSMFICEDHGTVETLLFEMFAASFGKTPLTFIPKGVLRDNSSYWKTPTFPIVTNFATSEITEGVNRVVLSSATAFLGGEFLAGLGWQIIGSTSAQYSFVDVNNDGMFTQGIDNYKLPTSVTDLMKEQEGGVELAGDILELGIPLGGYPQAVFTAKEVAAPNTPLPSGNGTYSSRVFIATDATWLDNELTSISDFDNLKLGLNVMKYLSCGRDPEDVIVVFDEAHIRPESGATEISSAATFGQLQAYVNWLSTNPILSLVYPVFSLYSLRKWIPKEEEKKKLQLKDLEEAERAQQFLKFRTSSFFAQKINWYRVHKKYRLALLQLYRRLQRRINRLLGDSAVRDINAIMAAIERERGKYISKDVLKRMRAFFEKMDALQKNKDDVKDEEEFERLFLEMSWVADNL